MTYERWAKRMDDAVESSWLRGLRSQARAQPTGRHRFVATPRPKTPLGKLDRSIAAGVDR
jgi:hypothetical protein